MEPNGGHDDEIRGGSGPLCAGVSDAMEYGADSTQYTVWAGETVGRGACSILLRHVKSS